MQRGIPFMQMRGGSSKGLFFRDEDLPADAEVRDRVILAAMTGAGPDDPRQIDGLGGADPLTSKVAIVSSSDRDDADIDYEFVQVMVGRNAVDRSQNCGNILAGVVPFAMETGMIAAVHPETAVRVFMKNSGSLCRVTVRTPGGAITYTGDTRIDGVPGTSAPVLCSYADTAGSACGALLPTGRTRDTVDGIEITCIDNGMPIIMIRAADLGITGYESADELMSDTGLRSALERIRRQAGPMMNLGDVGAKSVPKMTLIAPPRSGGLISTRSFIPHSVHAAIGVLAAVSTATGCIVPGSVAAGLAVPPGEGNRYSIEHPSGEVTVSLDVDFGGQIPMVRESGIVRTARCLSRGEVLIPEGIW